MCAQSSTVTDLFNFQVQKFDMIILFIVSSKIRGCQLDWFETELDSARAMFNLLRAARQVGVYTPAEGKQMRGGECLSWTEAGEQFAGPWRGGSISSLI